jgi:hypothetical protein
MVTTNNLWAEAISHGILEKATNGVCKYEVCVKQGRPLPILHMDCAWTGGAVALLDRQLFRCREGLSSKKGEETDDQLLRLQCQW